MLQGNVIFPNDACAILKEYKQYYSTYEPHIVFAKALTIDVAFYIINNPVCGIITEESSFATHGANILRCYYRNSKAIISWVSGITYANLFDLFGKKIFIASNGKIDFYNDNNYYNREKAERSFVSYVPMSKKSILEYNISNKTYSICYWPHRKFDRLTFSIMQKGLCNNLKLFGVNKPYITLDHKGNIWFKNAPLISDLSLLAKNKDKAFIILQKQINLYQKIYYQLKCSYSFSDLIDMLIDYFSIFLLFHDTYEDVLVDADSLLKNCLEETHAIELMNLLMSCKLDEWILSNNLVLKKRKKLLSLDELVPIPDFSIVTDIDYCMNRYYNAFVNLGKEDLWMKYKNIIEYYINFFVAKEWKFITNKLLFTRFSNYLREIIPNVSFSELSLMDIAEVKKMVDEVNNEQFRY